MIIFSQLFTAAGAGASLHGKEKELLDGGAAGTHLAVLSSSWGSSAAEIPEGFTAHGGEENSCWIPPSVPTTYFDVNAPITSNPGVSFGPCTPRKPLRC